MVSIRLFGSPEISQDEQPLPVERRKSRALLYYLAASSRPVQREHLLAFFWPDTPRASAQQVLRTSLSGLRKPLGSALLVERDTAWIDPQVEVDARTLESSLSTPPANIYALESVLDLYRGPFLSDFSLPDSVEFEQWLESERERYLRLVMRGFSTLSRMYESTGDLEHALASLDRALALDSLQEDIQREAIRLAYLSGDRPAAIRRYDQLRRLLDEELGVPPMAETRSLYDDIINDHLQAAAQVMTAARPVAVRPARPAVREASADLPFTSREVEERTLNENAFSGQLVLVEGEPGIGKTRLLTHFLSQHQALCLCGTARELEQSLPYQPVIEGLRALQTQDSWPALLAELRRQLPPIWLQEVARLVPEIDPQGGGQVSTADEWRLWEGLSQFLLALSRLEPVFFFIDDLHWADASTLGLLGYLVRHAGGARLGFLGATRVYPARSALANLVNALIRERRVVRIPLQRLTPQEVYDIARQLSPGQYQALGEWLEHNSEGNPLILTELVRFARQSRLLRPDATLDETALPAAPVVPQTVYSPIQSRLAGLSDAARRMLDAAVVVGRDFDFDLVAGASALSEEAALDGLDELVESGLISQVSGPHYRFHHNVIMEVARQELGEARQQMLHRRIAEAMEALSRRSSQRPVPGLLAFHYMEGNDPRRAAPYAFQAGQQAARLAAWNEAIAFYEQALLGTDGWPRYAIWIALGNAQVEAGEAARASETFRLAVSLAEAQKRQSNADEARLLLAQSLLPQARFAESIQESRKVIRGGLAENAAKAELWWGTALSLEGADLEAAAEHLNCAAEQARQNNTPEFLAQVEFELGSLWAQRGDLPSAIEHYRQALGATENVDTLAAIDRHALAYNNLAYHLLLLGDPSAEEYAQAGMKLAREKGLVWVQTYLYSTLGEIAMARKDWQAAEINFTTGLELAHQLAVPERVAGFTANLGLLAREQGKVSLAIHRLSTARAQADDLGLRHLGAQIRIWLAPLLPPEEARVQLSEAREIAVSGGRKRLLEEIEQVEQGIK